MVCDDSAPRPVGRQATGRTEVPRAPAAATQDGGSTVNVPADQGVADWDNQWVACAYYDPAMEDGDPGWDCVVCCGNRVGREVGIQVRNASHRSVCRNPKCTRSRAQATLGVRPYAAFRVPEPAAMPTSFVG